MNKQNNDWREKAINFYHGLDGDYNENREKALLDFVENLLKEQLNRVNKEVEENTVKISQFDASCFGGLMIRHLGHPNFQDEVSGIKELCEMFLELNSKLKYKFRDDEIEFVEQRQKLDLIKGEIKL